MKFLKVLLVVCCWGLACAWPTIVGAGYDWALTFELGRNASKGLELSAAGFGLVGIILLFSTGMASAMSASDEVREEILQEAHTKAAKKAKDELAQIWRGDELQEARREAA